MSDFLPDPRSDKIAPAVQEAQRIREKIIAGAVSVADRPAGDGSPEEETHEPRALDAGQCGSKPTSWWNYMPNETQLMVFLADWIKQRRGQVAVQLAVPLPNLAEAKIPVVAYSVTVTETQLVLLVDPEIGGLQLPSGYELKVITPDRTFPKAVYLGSFQPLPSFPFAVVSFLLEPTE